MAWIRTVSESEASGSLAAQYKAAAMRAGKVFNILKIQSLNPSILKRSMDLYIAAMHGVSGLSRAEREMLATVVSATNGCHY